MARRVVASQKETPRKLFAYSFTRPQNSVSDSALYAAAAAADDPPPLHIPITSHAADPPPRRRAGNPPSPTATAPIIDLTDSKALFASIPTSALLRAAANLHVAGVGPVVDLGTWVLNSRMMEIDVLRKVILGTVRNTFYQHFCAGEDYAAVGETVRRLHGVGLRSMLDYAVEFADDNEACDRNLEGFIRTIEATKSLPPGSASFVAVKITAICPLKLLERISDLLRWQQKNPSFHLPWKLDTFPIFSPSTPLYHTLKQPDPLAPNELQDLHRTHQRLTSICRNGAEANMPIAIDAEHTQVQPAIDYLTYAAAIAFNRGPTPTVYATIQTYLKDARHRLHLAADSAPKFGVTLGVKLVRGAYMSTEAKLAAALGFESPIHGSVEQTHACFNGCASFLLEAVARGEAAVILATHNVESGKMAAAKAREVGMEKMKEKVEFAQLYGMAEALSYGLKNAGFQVSKYMPFGKVETVIPYLLRRAEENRGLLGASGLDLHLMRKELGRRLMNPHSR